MVDVFITHNLNLQIIPIFKLNCGSIVWQDDHEVGKGTQESNINFMF